MLTFLFVPIFQDIAHLKGLLLCSGYVISVPFFSGDLWLKTSHVLVKKN